MILDPLQLFVANRLATDEFFTADPKIEVVTEALANFESEIDRVVGGLGLCAVVLIVEAHQAENQASKKIYFEKIDLRIRCLEDPELNRTGLSANDLAEICADCVRGIRPLGEEGGPLLFRGIQRAEDYAAPVARDAVFDCAGGMPRVPRKRPQIDPATRRALRDPSTFQPIPAA